MKEKFAENYEEAKKMKKERRAKSSIIPPRFFDLLGNEEDRSVNYLFFSDSARATSGRVIDDREDYFAKF